MKARTLWGLMTSLLLIGLMVLTAWVGWRIDNRSVTPTPEDMAILDNNKDISVADDLGINGDVRITVVGVASNITAVELHARKEEIVRKVSSVLGTNGLREIIVEFR